MSATARALPVIRPISDLRTRLNDVCAQATESREPIVLTKNGTAAYVLVDCSAYEELQQQQRYYLALREAELEAKYNPQPMSAAESDAKMHDIFALWGIDYA